MTMTFGRYVHRQIRRVQRKLLPAFTDFQVPSAQNNPYAKELRVAYSATLHLDNYFAGL